MALAAAFLAGGAVVATAQTSSLSKDDQAFLQSAYQGGLYEIEIGKYAAENGSDPKVKAFGQQMVTDHTALNQKVADLAQKKGVTLDMEPNAMNATKIKSATTLSGTAFDKTYLPLMIHDHKNDIKEFDKEAATTSDPDIKAAIHEALPTLHQHLKMAEEDKAALSK
jgi:putative membrane protein